MWICEVKFCSVGRTEIVLHGLKAFAKFQTKILSAIRKKKNKLRFLHRLVGRWGEDVRSGTNWQQFEMDCSIGVEFCANKTAKIQKWNFYTRFLQKQTVARLRS